MKATGIVRRVDDLGRIVIPKEIRRTLKIREGDPLEIYTEKDGGVIFRKYSPMEDLQEFASHICDAIHATTGRMASRSAPYIPSLICRRTLFSVESSRACWLRFLRRTLAAICCRAMRSSSSSKGLVM